MTTQADRTADMVLELNRARHVVAAAREAHRWMPEDLQDTIRLGQALDYYDRVISEPPAPPEPDVDDEPAVRRPVETVELLDALTAVQAGKATVG